ncbi:MAG: DUF262 domain-containing protein [Pseudomonadota bacterium]
MDTGQKTESLAQLVEDIDKQSVVLPEFQRDFVWEIEKTFDLFDSFIKDIFVGSLIYGIPSFEITVRELDSRPRAGKGSRTKLKLTSFTRSQIEKLVKTTGFRLLLDGQQRATSIYRSLKGIDPIFIILFPDEELPEAVRTIPTGKRTLEQVTKAVTGAPMAEHVCIKLSDVYATLRGEMPRERDKVKPFRDSTSLKFESDDKAQESDSFNAYLTQMKNLENMFRQEKLIAYYLLDTDEEKFALFFERSNSKGIQLNFIDILAAKLYVGFNLRNKVEEFEDEAPQLSLNREAVVRAISFIVSGGKDTGRGFILGNLTHVHFTEHWPIITTAYKKAYDYLFQNRLLIHKDWVPYENMLIPLMIFLRQLPGNDFAEMNALQRRIVQTWYWFAAFARRYSSAAQTLVLEDAQNLERVGRGDFSEVSPWLGKMHPLIVTPDDLYGVSKQYDAAYKGIHNLVHFISGGLINWQGGDRLSPESSLEDHHIFPRDYLLKVLEKKDADSVRMTDCVVNRTLIPKLQNIRISNKPPSKYLAELQVKNPKLATALEAHFIPKDLIGGTYDDIYEIFLEDRAKKISDLIVGVTRTERELLARDLGT